MLGLYNLFIKDLIINYFIKFYIIVFFINLAILIIIFVFEFPDHAARLQQYLIIVFESEAL